MRRWSGEEQEEGEIDEEGFWLPLQWPDADDGCGGRSVVVEGSASNCALAVMSPLERPGVRLGRVSYVFSAMVFEIPLVNPCIGYARAKI